MGVDFNPIQVNPDEFQQAPTVQDAGDFFTAVNNLVQFLQNNNEVFYG